MTQEIRMTEAEYDEWCWTVEERTEFADGKVIFLSPEGISDERLRGFLHLVLRLFLEQLHLGEVFGPNLQTRLPAGSRRVPDLLFVSKARQADLERTYVRGGPDLAIEIVSEDSQKRDRIDKYAEYEGAGVREYWMVDAELQHVDAYTMGPRGRYVPLPIEEGVLRSRVLPGFCLRTEWLWMAPSFPSASAVMKEMGVVLDPELQEKLDRAEARAWQAESKLAEEASVRKRLEAENESMREELRRQRGD